MKTPTEILTDHDFFKEAIHHILTVKNNVWHSDWQQINKILWK